MRRATQIEECFCDFCGEPSMDWYRCFNCGRDCCEKHQQRFNDGIFFTSTTGHFCLECLAILRLRPTALFSAYRAIELLHQEHEAWQAQFKTRTTQAETSLKQLIAKWRENKPTLTLPTTT